MFLRAGRSLTPPKTGQKEAGDRADVEDEDDESDVEARQPPSIDPVKTVVRPSAGPRGSLWATDREPQEVTCDPAAELSGRFVAICVMGAKKNKRHSNPER